jgi:hypothetical protein
MGARLVPLALLLIAAGAGCATTPAPPPPSGTTADLVRLRSASIEYYQAGPVDPVVEVRVILDTTATRHTDSTTILWDPAFAERFTFLRSDPPPWRVRVDENGWGSLDTSGVIPGQYGTFRLYFAAGTYEPLEPRLRVVANGDTTVADVFASASHLKWQAPTPQQQAFEHGPLSALAAVARIAPAQERPSFVAGAALSAVLLALTLGGSLMAFRLAR